MRTSAATLISSRRAQRARGAPAAAAPSPLSSALDHSCEPNAVCAYDPFARVLITRALRRIAPGERVTVAVVDLSVGFVGAARVAHLAEVCGDVCTCALCAAPPLSPAWRQEAEALG